MKTFDSSELGQRILSFLSGFFYLVLIVGGAALIIVVAIYGNGIQAMLATITGLVLILAGLAGSHG